MTWNAEPHKIVPEAPLSPPRNSAFSSLNIGWGPAINLQTNWSCLDLIHPSRGTCDSSKVIPPTAAPRHLLRGRHLFLLLDSQRPTWLTWSTIPDLHTARGVPSPWAVPCGSQNRASKSSSMSSRSPSISFKGRCWTTVLQIRAILQLQLTFPGSPFANPASPKKNKSC